MSTLCSESLLTRLSSFGNAVVEYVFSVPEESLALNVISFVLVSRSTEETWLSSTISRNVL